MVEQLPGLTFRIQERTCNNGLHASHKVTHYGCNNRAKPELEWESLNYFKSLNSRTNRYRLLFSLLTNTLAAEPTLRAPIHKENFTKIISQEYILYTYIKIQSKLESGSVKVQCHSFYFEGKSLSFPVSAVFLGSTSVSADLPSRWSEFSFQLVSSWPRYTGPARLPQTGHRHWR